jgi:glucose-6-phosphate 1-dehydrogenase
MSKKRKKIPTMIVIFGASGDLTARKLIPAFYHLFGK